MIWPEIGDRVKIIRMVDPDPVSPGTVGDVVEIDKNVGQIWVRWPIKGKLGFYVNRPILVDVDRWEIVKSNPLLPPKPNSTRSNIVIKDSFGEKIMFYKHWDGYPDNNMPIIMEFMKLLEEGKIRYNAKQSAGWLFVLGIKYMVLQDQRINHGKFAGYPLIDKIWMPKDCNDLWAIEPCTKRHGDIEYFYIIDLEKKKVWIEGEGEKYLAYPKNETPWTWEPNMDYMKEKRNPPETINNPNNIYEPQESESSTETGKHEAEMPKCPTCKNIILEPIETNPAGAFKCPKCEKAFMPKLIEKSGRL
jgi:hypothetical protein